MRKRENGLDLLRCIAAFGVVLAHVVSPYKHYYEPLAKAGAFVPNATSWIIAFLRMQNWVVPAFFMMSGAYILSSAKTGDFRSFYRKTWKKLGIPTLIWTLVYGIVCIVYYRFFYGVDFGTAAYLELGQAVLGTPAAHLWYMFALIGMYLAAPFLVLGKEKLSKRGWLQISLVVYIWGTVSAILQPFTYYWSLNTISSLLGVFMMGNVIHERIGERKNRGLGLACIGGGLACMVILMVLYHKGVLEGQLPNWVVQIFADLKPFGPLITIGGGLFFAGFRLLDVKKEFVRLGGMTFDVYLVHGIFLMAFSLLEKQMGLPDSVFGQPISLLEVLINAILVYVCSFGVAALQDKWRSAHRQNS